jgi:hypothetical protein
MSVHYAMYKNRTKKEHKPMLIRCTFFVRNCYLCSIYTGLQLILFTSYASLSVDDTIYFYAEERQHQTD